MKNEKLLILLGSMCLITVLAMLPFMGACATKPAAGPMVLKWTSHEPDAPWSTQNLLKRLATQIEERTEGRVKIEVYWGSVLGKPPDFLKMVGGVGVADGGFIIPTYHQWEIPLFAGTGLPFLTTGYIVGGQATWELYNEWAPMQEEWENINCKPLMAFESPPHWIGLKQPITTLEDLKGKKLWVPGYWMALAEGFGIINVPMSAPEAYDALQKGVIEGIWGMPFHTWKIFRYSDTCKYMASLDFAGGQPVVAQAINLDVWNKISPGDQKAIEEICTGAYDPYLAEVGQEAVGLDKFYKEQGVTYIEFSPQEHATIMKVGPQLVWGDWLRTCEETGVPGEEFLERYKAKVEEVKKELKAEGKI